MYKGRQTGTYFLQLRSTDPIGFMVSSIGLCGAG